MAKKEIKKEAEKEAEVEEAPVVEKAEVKEDPVPEPAEVEIVYTTNGPMVKGPNGSLRPLPAEK